MAAAPQTSKQNGIDIEKQQEDEKNKSTDYLNEEPLEKVKEKPPPGINASLVVLYAVFFSMFTIGWVNLNSCSVTRLIPIYLIVAGSVGALAKFLSKAENKYLFNIAILLTAFYLVWTLLASYWVYREYQPNYELTKENKIYCNRTTYLLAFWILTFQYTLLGIFILLSICYMIMRGDFKKK